jgi:hypothetical protein
MPTTRFIRLSTLLLTSLFLVAPASGQTATLTRATTSFTGAANYAPTVAFANGTFVALGLKNVPVNGSTNTVSAWTSADGDTWTERVVTLPGGFANHGAVRFINNRFVFAGTVFNAQGFPQGYSATSADGVTWSVATAANANQFVDIASGNGVSVGFWATTLSSSTDGGTTWSERSAPGVGATSPYQAITFGNGRFVLASSSRVWSSADGVTWTDSTGLPPTPGRLAFGNGLFALTGFAAVGNAYRTSTDGITFTNRTPSGMSVTATNAIRFAAGRFLYHQFTFSGTTAINQIVSSADGINWTPFANYPAGTSFVMNDAASGNNRLVVVGYTGTNGPGAAFLDISNLPPPPAPPSITTQPIAANAVAGGTAMFSVAASGSGNAYQWRKDGVAIAGATNATLTLSNVSAANAGAYTVVVTNALGSVTSQPATLALVSASNAGRLVNLSVRTSAGTGDNTLIVGVGIGGPNTSGSKAVLMRGVGPALAGFGVSGALSDSVMTVFSGQTQVAQNDDWAGSFDFSSVGAFGLGANPRDAAIFNSALASGSYSIQITGKNNATGIALAEIYDATASSAFSAATPRLVNVSARTQVGTGDNILIAGFSIGGSTPVRLLIRAVGPTLAGFGVGGTLTDPRLEIYNGNTRVAENDNWAAADAAMFSRVGAFELTAGSRDAVIVTTLNPGTYTAQISGVGNTTGVALVEVYELP